MREKLSGTLSGCKGSAAFFSAEALLCETMVAEFDGA